MCLPGQFSWELGHKEHVSERWRGAGQAGTILRRVRKQSRKACPGWQQDYFILVQEAHRKGLPVTSVLFASVLPAWKTNHWVRKVRAKIGWRKKKQNKIKQNQSVTEMQRCWESRVSFSIKDTQVSSLRQMAWDDSRQNWNIFNICADFKGRHAHYKTSKLSIGTILSPNSVAGTWHRAVSVLMSLSYHVSQTYCVGSIICPFYSWWNWGREKISDLPRDTQLVRENYLPSLNLDFLQLFREDNNQAVCSGTGAVLWFKKQTNKTNEKLLLQSTTSLSLGKLHNHVQQCRFCRMGILLVPAGVGRIQLANTCNRLRQ